MPSDETKRVTPKLRFPEFSKAPDWKVQPLGSFVSALDAGVSVNAGDRPALADEVGVLKTSCVTAGVFEPSENKAVIDPGERARVKEPVRAGTILISRMNTVALVGANAYVDRDIDNLFLPDRLWAMKPAPSGSLKFIAHILSSGQGRAALSRAARGSSGSMKNIAKPDVLELSIAAPGEAEQWKIAECLSSLDAAVAAQGRKLEALREHKRGLMQALFPPEGQTRPRLRFPQFRNAGEWEETDLERVVTFKSGGTPSKSNPAYWNGTIPWASAKDMKEMSLEDTEDHITDQAVADGARKVPAGTILILVRGMTLLKDVPICIVRRPMSFNQDVKALRVKGGLGTEFLAYLLLASKQRLMGLVDTAGHGTGRLNTDKLRRLALTLPKPSEQQHIAACLSSLDALIAAASAKLDALRAHKKGLMQQLFPSPEAGDA